jgi:membrane fusion protein, multidrug efflux system
MSSITSRQRKKVLMILAGLGIFVAGMFSFDDVRSTTVDLAPNNPIIVAPAAPTLATGNLTTQKSAIESERLTVENARVAVALSQAQLLQSQTNLIEFQSEYDLSKTLFEKGTVSRQQLDTAKAAYELAQVQKGHALIGVRESSTQLVAAKAEVSKTRTQC